MEDIHHYILLRILLSFQAGNWAGVMHFSRMESVCQKNWFKKQSWWNTSKRKCVYLAEMDFNTASPLAVFVTAGMLITLFKFTKASSTAPVKGNYLLNLPNCAGFAESVLSTFWPWFCKCFLAAPSDIQGGYGISGRVRVRVGTSKVQCWAA